eukprot:gene12310-biopygen4504
MPKPFWSRTASIDHESDRRVLPLVTDGRIVVQFTGTTKLPGNRMHGLVTDCRRIQWNQWANKSVWCRGGEGADGWGYASVSQHRRRVRIYN